MKVFAVAFQRIYENHTHTASNYGDVCIVGGTKYKANVPCVIKNKLDDLCKEWEWDDEERSSITFDEIDGEINVYIPCKSDLTGKERIARFIVEQITII